MTQEFSMPRSVAEEVSRYLMRQLLLGKEYPPGSFIREDDLANKLQVSRSPIREALRELENHGLIQTIPRRGAMVTELTKQDIIEIYDVRLALESIVYKHIVSNNLLTDERYERLLSCFEKFKSVSAVEDREEAVMRFLDIDLEFHFFIVDFSGLVWTRELLRKTYTRLYKALFHHIYRTNLDSLSEYHSLIVENLRDGNLDALKTLSIESYMTARSYFSDDVDEYRKQ